ncbi:MAG: hypothetical protein P1U46_03725 [Patescibacteria group bacterium]|nr:hypothetical protein [Patescibacteria group bacterium]
MKWLNLEIDEKSKLFFQEERRIINLLDKKMYLEALDLCTNKILYSEKDEKDIFFGLLQIVLEKIEDISKNLNNEEKIESYNALLNGYLNNIRNIVIEK